MHPLARTAPFAAACVITFAVGCGQGTTHEPATSNRPDATPVQPVGPTVTDLSESIRAVRSAWKRGATDEYALRDIRLACDTKTEWRQVVEGLDVIHMRSKWPKTDELVAWIRGVEWTQGVWRVTAIPTDMRMNVITASSPNEMCGNAALWDLAQHRNLRVGYPWEDLAVVEWDVSIDVGKDFETKSSCAWAGRIRLPIRVVASLDEVIPVVRLPQLDTVVRNAIFVGQPHRSEGLTFEVVAFTTDPDLTTGVSLRVELLRGTESVEVVLVPCRIEVGDHGQGSASLSKLPLDLSPARADSEGWTLHVTGTNEGLLDSWEVERAWGGEFTMPLSEAMTRYEFPK